jgi:hypothetical protein
MPDVREQRGASGRDARLAEATPHARVLTGLEGVLQADLGDGAPGADGLGLLDLVDGGPVLPTGKKSSGSAVRQAALSRQSMEMLLACTSFADALDCACRIRLLQGESRISGSRIMTDRLTSL